MTSVSEEPGRGKESWSIIFLLASSPSQTMDVAAGHLPGCSFMPEFLSDLNPPAPEPATCPI